MSDVVCIEGMNKPAVALVNRGFVIDGSSSASVRGYPGIRIITENIPCECSVQEEIEAGVSAIVDDIVAGLTRPLTVEEQSPKPKEVEKPARIVFKGNLEEVNRFFYRRGWTDGLPVIPPTEEAVAEMLTGTDLPPDYLLGKIEPRFGKATVEKIAISAVMAGALPTYMPVLIAGVQALMDPECGFSGWTVSTGSWTPFWIINGPIRNTIHLNSSSGALSPGDMANAAIGRAMGLAIKNIGGARKGIEDMGVMGNPGKYTMVIAENEEESPWEPLHVEHGFNKIDSTVTLFSPNCFWQTMPFGTNAKGILSALASFMSNRAGGGICFLLNPTHASWLANSGRTKKDIIDYLFEYASISMYRFQSRSPQDSSTSHGSTQIIVAGGPGNQMGIIAGAPFHRFITKKVEFPKSWDNLVRKYRDIIPQYIKY